jgi:hypothetical protein
MGSIRKVSRTKKIEAPIQYFCLPIRSMSIPGWMISKNFCCAAIDVS